MTEFILIAVFIFSLISVHTKLKGTKVYEFFTLLALPFLMSYLFFNLREYNFTDYLMILLFAGGFIYQAVKFYDKYLKQV
ncbi:MAG TPA: hypothetical protein VIN10_10415 [Bacteroidales bacterium]